MKYSVTEMAEMFEKIFSDKALDSMVSLLKHLASGGLYE